MCSSSWINQQLQHIPGFLGCVNQTTLPDFHRLKHERCWLVVNTEVSPDKMGHWVTVFVDRQQSSALIFDPLGEMVEGLCVHLAEDQRLTVIYNHSKVQCDTSQSCGKFALLFVLCQVSCPCQFDAFLTLFHLCQPKVNETLLSMYLEKNNLT